MKRSPLKRSPMKRTPMKKIGKRGKERKAEWEKAKKAHLILHPTCEGPVSGLPGNCDGPTDVHHVIPRGAGGGKDFGEYLTLCRWHHMWVESHRKEAYELGLLKHWWEAENED